jgi:hypothetical protein
MKRPIVGVFLWHDKVGSQVAAAFGGFVAAHGDFSAYHGDDSGCQP